MCSVAPNPPSVSAYRSEHSPVHKVSWEGEESREGILERVRGEREEEWGARAFELERTQRRGGPQGKSAPTHAHGRAHFDQKKKTPSTAGHELIVFQSQHHLDSAGLFHSYRCTLITHQRIWPRVSKTGEEVSILFCLSFFLSLTRAFIEAGNAVKCVFVSPLSTCSLISQSVLLFLCNVCFVGPS